MILTYIQALEVYKFIIKLFGTTRKKTYRYVENTLEKYGNIVEYKYVHNNSKRLNQIKSNQTIVLPKGIELGATISQVRKKFSNAPHVKSFSSKGIKRHILLYKKKYDHQKIKIELHFHKNKLFFAKYIFSTTTVEEREAAINHFRNKYDLHDLEFIGKNIIDASNNGVKINNSLETTISYIQLDSPFFELLQAKTAINQTNKQSFLSLNLSTQ